MPWTLSLLSRTFSVLAVPPLKVPIINNKLTEVCALSSSFRIQSFEVFTILISEVV